MKRFAVIATALAATLALGFFAASGVASSLRAADSTDTTSTSAPPTTTDSTSAATSTTDPATTAAPTTDTTTTAATTTDATPTTDTTTTPAPTTGTDTTPTDPATTKDTTTTATTTVGGTDTGSNDSGVGQSSAQGAGGSGGAAAATGGPPAGCSTGQLSCGNNAANQIALVTQTCTNAQRNTLDIDITTPSGAPVQNVTVENGAVCMNVSQIEQTIRQYCVACTLVVQNFYSTTNETTRTTIVDQPTWGAYCMPKDDPILRGDGTVGWLVFLQTDQGTWDRRYAGAAPARWDPQDGYVCPGTAPAALPATFTLTVPGSLVGQYVNLCIQPKGGGSPLCHSIRIDAVTTVTIPVSSDITATMTKTPLGKPVSPKALARASGAFAGITRCTSGKAPKAGKKGKRRRVCAAKRRKHTKKKGKR